VTTEAKSRGGKMELAVVSGKRENRYEERKQHEGKKKTEIVLAPGFAEKCEKH